MFSKDEEVKFTLGGIEYSHSKRNGYVRCQYVCGGFTGLHPSGEFSTWSPGRFPIPETNMEIYKMMGKALRRYATWPERTDREGGYINEAAPGINVRLTCGMCQNICWGSPKETAENYKILVNSGCVIEKESGELIVLSPDEAEKEFDAMGGKNKTSLFYKLVAKVARKYLKVVDRKYFDRSKYELNK